MTPEDVSAVVCTMNSIASIEACLSSLDTAGVGEIIVVDASSRDGTRAIADRLATRVLEDPGTGLGQARNVGIAASSGRLVLNMGSDNVISREALQTMIDTLDRGSFAGVSAMTEVIGQDYLSRSLGLWRSTRFQPGPVGVIGTPTLFLGEQLRSDPFDSSREHSDDAELCERWTRKYGASYAISEATVQELGKTSWSELRLRCRNYGVSDHEVFTAGAKSGWSLRRRALSLAHPLRVDLLTPLSRAELRKGMEAFPFLVAVTGMRYYYWFRASLPR